jgi:hypothetical protein
MSNAWIGGTNGTPISFRISDADWTVCTTGFDLKQELKVFLKGLGIEPIDMGNLMRICRLSRLRALAEQVSKGDLRRDLICGTGRDVDPQ